MPRKGENIYKRKDGRWEGRYIKARSQTGKAVYGYVYAPTYKEAKSLSEILGHATVNITLNRYVHPSMELKQQNMQKLSSLLAVI